LKKLVSLFIKVGLPLNVVVLARLFVTFRLK